MGILNCFCSSLLYLYVRLCIPLLDDPTEQVFDSTRTGITPWYTNPLHTITNNQHIHTPFSESWRRSAVQDPHTPTPVCYKSSSRRKPTPGWIQHPPPKEGTPILGRHPRRAQAIASLCAEISFTRVSPHQATRRRHLVAATSNDERILQSKEKQDPWGRFFKEEHVCTNQRNGTLQLPAHQHGEYRCTPCSTTVEKASLAC